MQSRDLKVPSSIALKPLVCSQLRLETIRTRDIIALTEVRTRASKGLSFTAPFPLSAFHARPVRLPQIADHHVSHNATEFTRCTKSSLEYNPTRTDGGNLSEGHCSCSSDSTHMQRYPFQKVDSGAWSLEDLCSRPLQSGKEARTV